MAIILRGKRKGEVVGISQFSNNWVSLDDGTIMSPASLEYTTGEALRFFQDKHTGMLFRWYRFNWQTMRFIKMRKT